MVALISDKWDILPQRDVAPHHPNPQSLSQSMASSLGVATNALLMPALLGRVPATAQDISPELTQHTSFYRLLKLWLVWFSGLSTGL